MPMGSELEPWYPWAGAAVWSRGKRCLPDQLYLCATTEGQTLTVCSGQEKTKHGPWKCDVLQWEPLQRNLLSPVLLPFLFSHSCWFQCQKELFSALYFNEERSGHTCRGWWRGLWGHSVLQVPLPTAQARQAALLWEVVLWNFSLQKLVHRGNNTEQSYPSPATAPASYFLPPSTSCSNCISPVLWQQIGVGC